MPLSPTPSLRDVQRAVRDALLDADAVAAASFVVAADLAPARRLAVYRHTFESTAANALRLSYPAVRKLVGAEFFEGASRRFAREHPPTAPCLDLYGAGFADFLAAFPPAASLPYLPAVARLEHAVNCALHAPDAQPLDAHRLAAIDPDLHERIRFVADPSVALLAVDGPADAIWRSVLAGDDAALAAVDLADAPVHLLVARRVTGVEVSRIDEPAFRITTALVEGRPLGSALAVADASTAASVLAEHLAAGISVFHLPKRRQLF